MKQILINGKDFALPETWQEVPATQLPDILKLLYVSPENGGTYHEMIRIVLGYSANNWKKLMRNFFGKHRSEDQKQRSAESLQQILGCLSWMWKSELTVAPFDGIVINGKKWLVFEELFRTMSFGELTNAHINAQAFVKQLIPGEERLNVLVATVCRPEREGDYRNDPDWNGDKREPYNEHIARYRADELKDAYSAEKVLVLMYFLGSLKEFFSYYDLFESDSSSPPTPEEYPGQSMMKNQHLLSEKSIFGSMNATKMANVHEVFQFLEEHRKDIVEHNERVKAANEANH